MLLKAINEIMFRFEAHENLHTSTWTMKRQVCNNHQNNLDLAHYLENFQANIKITAQTGCNIWVESKSVDLELTGINCPILSLARTTAENWAQNKQTGDTLMMMENRTYDSRQANITNYFTMGEDHYPTLLIEA